MTEKFIISKRMIIVAVAHLFAAICIQVPAAGQWREIQGPEGASINVLFSHGDYLFAGTDNGILRSTDHGGSWKKVRMGEADPYISSFTAIGEALFAGSGGCIFRSSDYGQTWEIAEAFGEVTSIAAVGTYLFAGLRGGAPHVVLP